MSSIAAYTAAGILLGPVAGIVVPTSKLQVFLGIGVFILFFLVGLDEIDIPGFVSTIRGRFFYAATLSVVISMVAAMIVTSDLFGVDLPWSSISRMRWHSPASCRCQAWGLWQRYSQTKDTLKNPLASRYLPR